MVMWILFEEAVGAGVGVGVGVDPSCLRQAFGAGVGRLC